MNWKKVGKKIAEHAPLLGSVIGGPAGAGVGPLIASALGVDDNPSSIMTALQVDPDAAVKLQEIQNSHKERLEELAIRSYEAEASDRDSARRNNSTSFMPSIICVMLTVVMVMIGYALFDKVIPPDNREVAVLLFGTVIAKWGDSIAYWVGTTRSSAAKNDMLGVGR